MKTSLGYYGEKCTKLGFTTACHFLLNSEVFSCSYLALVSSSDRLRPATDASDCPVLKRRWLVKRALPVLKYVALGPYCTAD